MNDSLDRLVNLDRYPLHRLDAAAGRSLVDFCRRMLDRSGACVLPGFLDDAALTAARDDALALQSSAHPVDHEFAYDDVDDATLQAPLESLPPDHPRRFRSLTRIGFVARDLIDAANPVKRLHARDEMTCFIAQVMGQDSIYPSDCPLSGCVLTIAREGELQDWHFDGNDFIVTLMLEAPRHGGDFEYAVGLRDPDAGDDYDGIAAILGGERSAVIRPPIDAGTLTLFRGRYNLHRAAPVGADSRRIMAILSYETRPGITGTAEYLKLFYGRSLEDLA